MNLVIEEDVVAAYHPLVGVIVARGVDNTKAVAEIDGLFAEVAEKVRAEFAPLESPQKHPHLAAWRQAFKRFGADPQAYRNSAEALARRVLKGDSLPRINTLVDLYNCVSLKYVLPVGGEDTKAIVGTLRLAHADGTEEFFRIGSADNDPPAQGEVVYKDDAGVVCRRWNWREAERTKLTETTTDAIIVIDGVPPIAREAVAAATTELAGLIERFCGGTAETEVREH